MSDLDITIKLDPTQAVIGQKAVSSATKTLERDAKDAQAAYEQLTAKLAKTSHEMDRLAAKERAAAASGAAAGYTKRGPSAMSAIGAGAGNAILTGVSMAGASGLVDVVTNAARAWVDYEVAQTEAHNSLRKYFATAERTTDVLQAQTLAATHLGVNVREAADALGAVREASQGAYLSTLEQIDATRTLGEIMQMNGKSVGEAGNVMKQLQLAMEVGTVTGLQFKNILRENSDVVGVLSERTGKSAKELLEMAKSGQFGRDMIKEWFVALTDGSVVHEKWNQRQKTGIDLMIDLVPMLREGREAMEAENRAVLEAADAWEKFGLKYQEMHDQIEQRTEGLKGGIAMEVVNKALRETQIAAGKVVDQFETYTKSQQKAAAAAKQHADEVERLRKMLFDVGGGFKPGSNANQWEIEKAARERAIAMDAIFENFDKSTSGLPEGARSGGLKSAPDIISEKMPKATEEVSRFDKSVDDLANNSLANLQQMAQTVGDALVDAFMSGNFEAEKLLDTLAQMALKGAVSNLIGFGFAQLQPAATGLDAMVGVPRFAAGGDAMVRGAGGTDSRLAMLAVTPGESIHVRTPQQRAEMARSSGGRGVKIVNQIQDRRALLQSFDGDGDFEQVVMNVFQRHAGAIRSLGR